MEKTTLHYAQEFTKALEDASKDECYNLNLGVHDAVIRKAWQALLDNVTGPQEKVCSCCQEVLTVEEIEANEETCFPCNKGNCPDCQ